MTKTAHRTDKGYLDAFNKVFHLRDRRDNPFASTCWSFWKDEILFPEHPSDYALRVQSGIDSYKLAAQTAVWSSWVDETRQYSPKDLHHQARIRSWYKQWLVLKEIPELLTFREYWYLAMFLREDAKTVDYIEVCRYQHLTEPGLPGRKIKTKIGRTYGTWLVTGLQSRDERQQPTFYKVMCNTCGHQHERFAYTRLGHPCPNCIKASRPAKPKQLKDLEPTRVPARELKEPTFTELTAWQTPDGWLLQPNKPEDALAKLVFTQPGTLANVERLEGAPPRTQTPPKAPPPTPKPQPQHEPAREPTAFEKTFSNLELPDFDATPRTTPWHNPHAEPAPEAPPKSDKPTLVELLMRPITAEEMRTGKNNWNLED